MRMKFEEEGTEMLPEENLVFERGHPLGHGVQRLYRYRNGYGLTVSRSDYLHPSREVWQLLVVKDISRDGTKFRQADDKETPFKAERLIKAGDREKNVVKEIDAFAEWAYEDAVKKMNWMHGKTAKTEVAAEPVVPSKPSSKRAKREDLPGQIDLEDVIKEKKQ